MIAEDFRAIAAAHRIFPQIDIDGSLQDGFAKLIEQLSNPLIHFVPSDDQSVKMEEEHCSFLGETLLEAIIMIENEHPVAITIIETEEGGVDVSLEYYPRRLTFEEAIRYRRAHSES